MKISEVIAAFIVAVMIFVFCAGAVSLSVILARMAFGF